MGHVARMRERRGAYRVLVGRDHLEDKGEDWRIIFNLMFIGPCIIAIVDE